MTGSTRKPSGEKLLEGPHPVDADAGQDSLPRACFPERYGYERAATTRRNQTIASRASFLNLTPDFTAYWVLALLKY